MKFFITAMSNFLSTDVVVSILVSVYSHKHRVDYTTVHYMVHTICYTLQITSQIVPFLIAGRIWSSCLRLNTSRSVLVDCTYGAIMTVIHNNLSLTTQESAYYSFNHIHYVNTRIYSYHDTIIGLAGYRVCCVARPCQINVLFNGNLMGQSRVGR